MGRAFEFRKARKMKRWGNMAKTFTRIGKQISIAVKAGGPDRTTIRHCVLLLQLQNTKICRKTISSAL
jgi:transcriptional/translational regulatory protein YebC/TACO1